MLAGTEARSVSSCQVLYKQGLFGLVFYSWDPCMVLHSSADGLESAGQNQEAQRSCCDQGHDGSVVDGDDDADGKSK